MNKTDKIYVAGHTGMVGSAIVRRLMELGYHNFIFSTSKETDLRKQDAVFGFLKMKNLTLYSLLPQRLVAYSPTIHTVLNFCMTI